MNMYYNPILKSYSHNLVYANLTIEAHIIYEDNVI